MRRGLGTADEDEAEQLVSEMNAILSDPSWWNAAKRSEAESKFSKTIIDAFYDEIQAGRDDPAARRRQADRLSTGSSHAHPCTRRLWRLVACR